MIKKLFRLVVSLTAIPLFFSGCATIVSKSSYPVHIRTSPAGAAISITDKKGKIVFNGKSPALISLKSGAGYFSKAAYQVSMTMPGYDEQIVTINYKLNGWYFGNLLIGGLLGMLIIDPLTGAMWKIDDPIINETLTKTGSTVTEPSLQIKDISEIPIEMQSRLVKIR